MATDHHIRNPIEWGMDELKAGAHVLEHAAHGLSHHEGVGIAPAVAKIETKDLWVAIRKGVDDLGTSRSDVPGSKGLRGWQQRLRRCSRRSGR